MAQNLVILPPESRRDTADLDSIMPDLISCQAHLCLHLQKEFDISAQLITQMVNLPQFTSPAQFIIEQCQTHFTEVLNLYKTNFANFSVSQSNNQDMEINPGEREKCGRILNIAGNGYIEYCNLHKYMHPHPEMNISSKGSAVEHQFIVKDNHQIIREHFQNQVYSQYVNYINRAFNLIKTLFYYLLHQWCQIDSIPIICEPNTSLLATLSSLKPAKSVPIDLHKNPQIANLIKQMQDNTHIFKSKVLYENVTSQNDMEESKIVSSYYLKIYRVKGEIGLFGGTGGIRVGEGSG